MRRGVLKGMFSESAEHGSPQYVWSVDEAGEAYEAKTDAKNPGPYHGYRLGTCAEGVGRTMPASLTLTTGWEALDAGSPEERACFAALGIQARGSWLSEGRDAFANRLRQAPLLSAYHLAEWFAWNWWRLRWEPRSRARDCDFAHRVSSIGGGYVWPNITIFSDGERTALIAKPTAERPETQFRYISDCAAVIPAVEFESEIDRFIDEVLQRLETEGVEGTNLEAVWKDVCAERRTPEEARRRKLEALLGYDADEASAHIIDQMMKDAEQLSRPGIEEIAAEHGQSGTVLTAADISEIARHGYEGSPRNVVSLEHTLPSRASFPAWLVGRDAARALREQLGLESEPISDVRLADIGGVQTRAIQERAAYPGISFVLEESFDRSRVVFRSKWRTGRRFEFARLLGDRIVIRDAGKFFPATRAYTYRQKMQRSFAAEFLSPFEAVDELLAGDYSMENQLDVAEHFEVSPVTVSTLLVNHERIKREALDDELETESTAAAASD
jgi:hypothetical protein